MRSWLVLFDLVCVGLVYASAAAITASIPIENVSSLSKSISIAAPESGKTVKSVDMTLSGTMLADVSWENKASSPVEFHLLVGSLISLLRPGASIPTGSNATVKPEDVFIAVNMAEPRDSKSPGPLHVSGSQTAKRTFSTVDELKAFKDVKGDKIEFPIVAVGQVVVMTIDGMPLVHDISLHSVVTSGLNLTLVYNYAPQAVSEAPSANASTSLSPNPSPAECKAMQMTHNVVRVPGKNDSFKITFAAPTGSTLNWVVVHYILGSGGVENKKLTSAEASPISNQFVSEALTIGESDLLRFFFTFNASASLSCDTEIFTFSPKATFPVPSEQPPAVPAAAKIEEKPGVLIPRQGGQQQQPPQPGKPSQPQAGGVQLDEWLRCPGVSFSPSLELVTSQQQQGIKSSPSSLQQQSGSNLNTQQGLLNQQQQQSSSLPLSAIAGNQQGGFAASDASASSSSLPGQQQQVPGQQQQRVGEDSGATKEYRVVFAPMAEVAWVDVHYQIQRDGLLLDKINLRMDQQAPGESTSGFQAVPAGGLQSRFGSGAFERVLAPGLASTPEFAGKSPYQVASSDLADFAPPNSGWPSGSQGFEQSQQQSPSSSFGALSNVCAAPFASSSSSSSSMQSGSNPQNQAIMGSNRDLMWQRQFGSSWSGFGQQPIQQGGLSSFDSSSQQLHQQPSWSDKNMFMTSNFGNLNTENLAVRQWPSRAFGWQHQQRAKVLAQGEVPGGRALVSTWKKGGLQLRDTDSVRVWFTYRSTFQEPHVDCDSRLYVFSPSQLNSNIGLGPFQDRQRTASGSQRQQTMPAERKPREQPGQQPAEGRIVIGSRETIPGEILPQPIPAGTQQTGQTGQTGQVTPAQQEPGACAGMPVDIKLVPSNLGLMEPGGLNMYKLIFNASIVEDPIKWVDVHYLQSSTGSVNLRMGKESTVRALKRIIAFWRRRAQRSQGGQIGSTEEQQNEFAHPSSTQMQQPTASAAASTPGTPGAGTSHAPALTPQPQPIMQQQPILSSSSPSSASPVWMENQPILETPDFESPRYTLRSQRYGGFAPAAVREQQQPLVSPIRQQGQLLQQQQPLMFQNEPVMDTSVASSSWSPAVEQPSTSFSTEYFAGVAEDGAAGADNAPLEDAEGAALEDQRLWAAQRQQAWHPGFGGFQRPVGGFATSPVLESSSSFSSQEQEPTLESEQSEFPASSVASSTSMQRRSRPGAFLSSRKQRWMAKRAADRNVFVQDGILLSDGEQLSLYFTVFAAPNVCTSKPMLFAVPQTSNTGALPAPSPSQQQQLPAPAGSQQQMPGTAMPRQPQPRTLRERIFSQRFSQSRFGGGSSSSSDLSSSSPDLRSSSGFRGGFGSFGGALPQNQRPLALQSSQCSPALVQHIQRRKAMANIFGPESQAGKSVVLQPVLSPLPVQQESLLALLAAPRVECAAIQFSPQIVAHPALTQDAADQNNVKIIFRASNAPPSSVLWVDVHYSTEGGVQRNYRMEKTGDNEFEHVQPGFSEGIKLLPGQALTYSFTFKSAGLCDTQQFQTTAPQQQQQGQGQGQLQQGQLQQGRMLQGGQTMPSQSMQSPAGRFSNARLMGAFGQQQQQQLPSQSQQTPQGTVVFRQEFS